MDQLRAILFKDIWTVRINDMFERPEMATDLMESDLKKLNMRYCARRRVVCQTRSRTQSDAKCVVAIDIRAWRRHVGLSACHGLTLPGCCYPGGDKSR